MKITFNFGNSFAGCLIALLHVVLCLVWGAVAWQWTNPTTFWRGMLFMLLWGVLFTACELIFVLAVTFLEELSNRKK
jgi:hypothetical protein